MSYGGYGDVYVYDVYVCYRGYGPLFRTPDPSEHFATADFSVHSACALDAPAVEYSCTNLKLKAFVSKVKIFYRNEGLYLSEKNILIFDFTKNADICQIQILSRFTTMWKFH